ncbi:MAG TPA: AraC family transcriptional regulator [Sphingomonas sp.]|nr:AraC family transcriptional regulator [Sphingomonas sp.]
MDPLSDILSLVKPTAYGLRGLDAGGDWALAFARGDGIRAYAIDAGACWLDVEGFDNPIRLRAGDLALLTGDKAYRLYSAADAPPIDAFTFFPTVPPGAVAVLNGGGGCIGVGGFFAFEGLHAEHLIGLLPPLVHVRGQSNRDDLRSSIGRLMRELRDPQPGNALIAGHFAQTLLVEALRLLLAERGTAGTGWLFALADARINAAMTALHAEPARRWTLATLAREAGMSRSSFSARFTQLVGEPAIDYLTRWRIMLAADRLANFGMSIATASLSVGYESESAFGAAFKRVTGVPPGQFARTARA